MRIFFPVIMTQASGNDSIFHSQKVYLYANCQAPWTRKSVVCLSSALTLLKTSAIC